MKKRDYVAYTLFQSLFWFVIDPVESIFDAAGADEMLVFAIGVVLCSFPIPVDFFIGNNAVVLLVLSLNATSWGIIAVLLTRLVPRLVRKFKHLPTGTATNNDNPSGENRGSRRKCFAIYVVFQSLYWLLFSWTIYLGDSSPLPKMEDGLLHFAWVTASNIPLPLALLGENPSSLVLFIPMVVNSVLWGVLAVLILGSASIGL